MKKGRKYKKGEYGYLRAERVTMLLRTAALLIAALAIYFTALFFMGSNQNAYTFIAVLLLLPTARHAVNFIALLRAKKCSAKAHEGIEKHIGNLDGSYDLYLTSEEKNYSLSHLAVGGRSVVALTEDPKCDTAEGEKHIRKMMQSNGIHGYTVKIFESLPKYEERLDQLNRLEESGSGKEHRKVLSLMHNISM